MTFHTSHHRVRYDLRGNIILEEIQDNRQDTAMPSHQKPATPPMSAVQLAHSTVGKKLQTHVVHSVWREVPEKSVQQRQGMTHSRVHSLLASSAKETRSQYAAFLAECRALWRQIVRRFHRAPLEVAPLVRAVDRPLALPQRLRTRKPSLPELFLLDTLKFGGTFAAIFIVLFSLVNYQSFLDIASAELAIGSDHEQVQALEGIVQKPLLDQAIAHGSTKSIVAYLPSVGPAEDRLIIPKIGKNVPIIQPSIQALMKEDWKQFETDLQDALRDGVIHYPGSAKAGQAGNFFLTGHSSYYPWDHGRYKEVFARLHELAVGDTYSVYMGGDLHTYRVIGKKEVRPNDVSVLDQPTDKRLSTLMTCTPVGTTLRRLIITAEEIDPSTGRVLAVGEHDGGNSTGITHEIQALPM